MNPYRYTTTGDEKLAPDLDYYLRKFGEFCLFVLLLPITLPITAILFVILVVATPVWAWFLIRDTPLARETIPLWMLILAWLIGLIGVLVKLEVL